MRRNGATEHLRATEEMEPKTMAQLILDECWPIDAFPVEPSTIAKVLNVRVSHSKLKEGVVAALLRVLDRPALIFLNDQLDEGQERFAIAKALGVLIWRTALNEFPPVEIGFEPGVAKESRFASEFATHLLVPDREIQRINEVSDAQALEDVAEHFGVSRKILKMLTGATF